MSLFRHALRLLGRRLPQLAGELSISGLNSRVTIRRDGHGVPHIDASTDADAFFGLGFCHAQDRGFQLETLLRMGRGTLAEVLGDKALSIDRVSRRIGFRRSSDAQLPIIADDLKSSIQGYVSGINAGIQQSKPAHEYAILGFEPTLWEVADVLAFLKLQSFMLPGNWDVELARLRLLHSDGPEAVMKLDPAPVQAEMATASSMANVNALSMELKQFQEYAPPGGGSNNWVIAGSRTKSGKPLLANDPHLAPVVPAWWYLAHIRTPEWQIAGATFVGGPAFPSAHNEFGAWGITAGLTDNTDLFIETNLEQFPVVQEVIRVKGKPDVLEEVHITPRGPIITPALSVNGLSLSMRAVWLDPLPLRGLMDAPRCTDFESFRKPFKEWPCLPLNLVYAGVDGTIGYQLVGQLPQRKSSQGLIPQRGDNSLSQRGDNSLSQDVDNSLSQWSDSLVSFEEMPHVVNPERGYIATANYYPEAATIEVGHDFCDGYRVWSIEKNLAAKENDWTVEDCLTLQLNVDCLPWESIRDNVLSLDSKLPYGAEALTLLRDWDGKLSADSAAASIYELFMTSLSIQVAQAQAPNGYVEALGGDGRGGAFSHSMFGDRRIGHLCKLIQEQPDGWFDKPWHEIMTDTLLSVMNQLQENYGPSPKWWHWGDLHTLKVRHSLLGKHKVLGPMFNLSAMPIGGDANTIQQTAYRTLDAVNDIHNIPNMRIVFDTANWDNCRYVLCGGESANPLSPHFDDLVPLWQRGEGVSVAWNADDVLRATKHTLILNPSDKRLS